MTIGEKGIDLIKSFEGLELHSYQDGAGVWTIGYGHTRGVVPLQTCTEAEATAFLEADLANAENAVNHYVTADLTQNMFDALVSLTFNLGAGNLEHSTLLRLLNGGSKLAAADEFLKWNKVAGKVSAGLSRRREAERELFLEA